METSKRAVGEHELTIHTVRTLIVGSGVGALNAAEHLHELGHDDVVIATHALGGASGDPASARSAYYRMGMEWEHPDSPADMAKQLCDGGMTHGDLAYVEAVNSIPEFLHLVRNGVPFPRDDYGRYTGSGQRGRLASAGPETSVRMAETSMQAVKRNRTDILNKHQVIALLTAGEGGERRAVGALAVDLRKASSPTESLVAFNCRNIILATGGPLALFGESIYPTNSPCGHALALKAGAACANLTETRFGLAFAKARRRLAGNYQRVIPSYYSVGKGGRDRRNFLEEYFHATKQVASAIFLKGEHWAFAAPQLQSLGASIIDIAVHNEQAAGRKVFVDFSSNVRGEKTGQFNISQLDPEAREFLEKTGSVQFSPYDRLRHLDPESIDSLIDHKMDLREPQEVTVCAEDTFGGLGVDLWWETAVPHLFAVGDAACTHGDPPPGAELNAGQVGGLRAAERIAKHYDDAPLPLEDFVTAAAGQLEPEIANLRRYVHGPTELPSVRHVRADIQKRTTEYAGMVRGVTGLTEAVADARKQYDSLRTDGQRLTRASEFAAAVDNELLCLTQIAFLEAMKACIEGGGGSRGAYLVLDEHGDANVLTKRGSELRHRNENMAMHGQVFETTFKGGTEFEVRAVPVRPIPAMAEPG